MIYILLIAGFVLLIKGADFFVAGSAGIARLLKVPSIIIGLTIVAMGTSLPEASVSITAALAEKNELALSNVLGSNLFNLLVVLGASSLIRSLPIQESVLKRDFPFSIIIAAILLLMSIPATVNGETILQISRREGLILVLLMVFYLILTIKSASKARHDANGQPEDEATLSLPLMILSIVGGAGAIVWGGDLVVDCASQIAASFGLSENLIGLTIVALGTSLPELVTSIVAARKGESDLAVGNVIGSNIFNILLILGLSSALHPVSVSIYNIYDTAILIISSILVYFLACTRKEINRREGLLCLLVYIAFFIFILIR